MTRRYLAGWWRVRISRAMRFVVASTASAGTFLATWASIAAAGLGADEALSLAGLAATIVATPLVWWAGREEPQRALPPAPPDTPTSQLVIGEIPREPPAFQARVELLDRLRELADGGSPAVVCSVTGTRGVGKTQLAAAYARARIDEGWPVAWISAEDHDQLMAGLDELADALGLPIPEGDSEAVAHKVRRWLSERGEPILVVFDNASHPGELRRWLPASGAAQIIITSTHVEFEDLGVRVAVGEYTEPEALAFLRDRTGRVDDDGARALAETLGFLPLALAQAAAVIRAQHLGYAEYTDLLRTMPLEEILGPYRADPYPSGVAETILLSLRTVEKADPRNGVQAVIEPLAVLSPNGVPKDLLVPTEADATGKAHALAALGLLAESSLVTFSRDDGTVLVHRLVQRVVRERARQDGTLLELTSRVVAPLAERFGPVAGSWSERRRADELIMQIEALWEHCGGDVLADPELASRVLELRARAVHHLVAVEDPTRAVPLARAVLRHREQVLGSEHPETLRSRHELARSCRLAGRLDEAIALYEQTVADRERILGSDHPDTLTSRHLLARAYRRRGRLPKTIALHERVLADRARILGAGHLDTLQSRNDLAQAYRSAGRLDEAIDCHERVLADREQLLGPDHPQTLSSQQSLAGAYRAAGRIREAIALYQRALAGRERVLGPDHPETMSTRNGLAYAYSRAGRTDEAVALHERVLADRERVLGANHRNVLDSRNDLGQAYRRAGRVEEAVALHERVLADRERLLGTDHVDTLRTRNSLANSYLMAGRVDEAIGLLGQVIADQERALGAEHPDTLLSRNDLALAYAAAGRMDEAIELHRQTLRISTDVLSPDHPDTLVVRSDLAQACSMAGRLDEAITLYEETLAGCVRALDPDHALTAKVRQNLAEMLNQQS